MNIDQQIREILSQSYPINDNRKFEPNAYHPTSKALVKGVSVVGNNNIVVASNFLLWELFALINIFCIMFFLH